MSYSEENGQVVLRMSREDYEVILLAMGSFTAPVAAEAIYGGKGNGLDRLLNLLNRLNSGNPNYTPYPTGDK